MTQQNSNKIKFSIGTPVMYRRYGVCTVVSTELQKFGDTEKLYYCLEPVYGKKTKFFVPADMADLDNIMRGTFAAPRLLDAIKSAESRQAAWEQDSRVRMAQFDDLLKNGGLEDMLWLMKLLYAHKREQREAGKTFVDADKRILAFAERLVADELCFVFGIDRTEVLDFIKQHAAD